MIEQNTDLVIADACSFQRSPVALFTMNEQNVVIAVSDGWLELLGYTRSEVIGQPIRAFWAPGTKAPPEPWQSVAPTNARIEDIERRYAHRNGTVVDVLVSSRRDGETVIAGVADISARRRAEEALKVSEDLLRQAQKMQALGQLAAGIAHDFNNILQAVSGAAVLIERRTDAQSRVRHFAEIIIRAANRGTSITQRLLSFARRGDLNAESIPVVEFFDDVREMLTPTLGATITILADIPLGIPALIADRGQLDTAMINIGTNARDAMPNGGRLVLSAGTEHVDEGKQHPAGLAPGDYVRLSVRDNGIGMNAATLERVSEPFFTTKSPGQGTGLGLAMVRGFAEQSGGAFSITSTLGIETTVVIWLRQSSAAECSVTRENHDRLASPSLSARVLLVEDNDMVRVILAAHLEEEGFFVLTAASGQEALALVKAGEAVDVMVSDLSMPGMDGIATIQQVRALRPLLQCFLLTGYTSESVSLFADNGFIVLHKPISGKRLAAQIKASLARE